MTTRIELAPEITEDLDRFFDFLAAHDVNTAAERVAALLEALKVLAHSPEIGRPVTGGKRELVIGKGMDGYLALYRYIPTLDVCAVLAIRAQREIGYRR
jgi:toxin ParE1/3/4